MNIKTIFFNIFFFIFLFIFSDIFFSNFIYKHNIGQKCYNIHSEGKFYELKKNCIAKMRRLSGIDSFKVYVDKYGNRYSGSGYNESNKDLYFIGDSHTFGLGLDWKDTFVGIVESEKKNYKITNLSVPSYSPTVFYYTLQKLYKNNKLKSDKVFVLIDITDVADESIRWNSSEEKIKPFLNFTIKNKYKGFKKFKRQNLKGSHIIATFIRESGRKIRKKLNYKNKQEKVNKKTTNEGTWPGRFTFTTFSELEGCNQSNNKNNPWNCGGISKGLMKIEKKMESFGELIKSTNSEFYIIIFPWPETLLFGQNVFNWENYIDKVCKISNCKKVINLFPEFRTIKKNREDWKEYLYLPKDFHLNINGSKILAEKILSEAF